MSRLAPGANRGNHRALVRPTTNAIRWWAIAGLGAVPATAVTLSPPQVDPLTKWTTFCFWLGLIAILRWSTREHYRGGWASGFARGVQAGLDSRAGEISPLIGRVYGESWTPEPWAPHTSPPNESPDQLPGRAPRRGTAP